MEHFIITHNYTCNIFKGINGDKKIVNEGLIRTYPIDKLIKHASQYCSFATSFEMHNSNAAKYQGVVFKTISNGVECINVFMHNGKYNETLTDNMFNTYGYFKSNVIKMDENFIKIKYEPKFSETLRKQLTERQFIYHLTARQKLENIFSIGLCPKQGKENFSYPDRVFFFVNNEPDTLLKDFINEKVENNSQYENGHFYVVDFVLLKINLEKCKTDIEFYLDPNMIDGVYTYGNIPSDAISIERDLKYRILKNGKGKVIERR